MSAGSASETITLDRLDRQLMHALQFDGRVSFRLLAEILGSSEQTVARRYRRLRDAGIVRVMVLTAPARGQYWIVRMQVVPGGAMKLARALARRADVSWVSIFSGGSEVTCVCRPRSVGQRDELLLDRLPETELVTGLVSHATLSQFAGGRVEREWAGYDDPLTGEQYAALDAARQLPSVPFGTVVPDAVAREDAPLLAELGRDGRASYATLAAATGSSAARVRRRLYELVSSGAAYLDVDLAIEALGFDVMASIWMTVAPSRLDEVGHRIAALPETAYVAAVTGPANLIASVIARDTDGLYRYVTEQLGSLEGVERAEVAPVLRRVKQAGSVVTGARLPPPGE
ncbi:MAG TPA: Lrp/AsnC family transcriptional regulator [Solirubrobacteraceae bacterium]|nr:Lrp/AsnC family transcriptional regulator [Solirubrobacteraceae bacterium]